MLDKARPQMAENHIHAHGGGTADCSRPRRGSAAEPRRGPRLVLAMIAGVVSALGFAVSLAPSASATTTSYVTTIHNSATGHCLDSNWAGQAYALTCNGGNYQKWTVVDRSDNRGVYTYIVDFETGKCLDSNSSGSLYTLSCNGGNYQCWDMSEDLLTSTWTLTDRATGRRLDSSGNGAYTLKPVYADPNQGWYLR
jgi:ricin-type beta-trefoil lectin protein